MRTRIGTDIKIAMKAGEKAKVGALRLVNAAIQSADVECEMKGKPKLTDADILGVLAKMVKQRRDSIEQFAKGGRPDLVATEQAEITVIEAYLPKQMSEAEALAAVHGLVKELGASGPKDMGKVMAALKERFSGTMDMGKASGWVKEALK